MKYSKEPVKLRRRMTSKGLVSLYLDTYYKGRREAESLRLYLVPETDRQSREKNRETLRLAEAIRARRVIEVQSGEYGLKTTRSDVSLYDYAVHVYEDKYRKPYRAGHSSEHTMGIAIGILKELSAESVKLRQVDTKFLTRFVSHLETATRITADNTERQRWKPNTRLIIYASLRFILNQAVREGYLQVAPASPAHRIKGEDTTREFLTIAEIKLMAATPYWDEQLRRMFIFSCLTGLRYSDVAKLRWGEVRQSGRFTRITFRQKKTRRQEYYDITDEAVPYMGERGCDDELVFGPLAVSSISRRLRRWAQSAGITKPITFHSARHSFAVMMLDLGVDIYTVQKLLGHRSLATTSIYAKLQDNKKQSAVSRIPKIEL